MEFWGVEVKSGEPLKVKREEKILHFSHAALGESKREKDESVLLFISVDGQKLVLGSLSSESTPQQTFDVVFDRDIELSHNWANGSVFFLGYKTDVPVHEDESSDEDSESDDDIPLPSWMNDKSETKMEPSIPATVNVSARKSVSSENPEAKASDPKPKEDDTDDSSDSDYDSSGSDEDEDMDGSDSISDEEDADGTDEDDEDEAGEDIDEETPTQAEPSKKRTAEPATKTPVPSKKAKFVSPEKTEAKKENHIATPYPSKQAGKAAAGGHKKDQTPESNTQQVLCKSCSRTFKSEAGLQSHTKAKHSGK